MVEPVIIIGRKDAFVVSKRQPNPRYPLSRRAVDELFRGKIDEHESGESEGDWAVQVRMPADL